MTPEFISQLKRMTDAQIHALVAKHIAGDARYRASLAGQLVEAKHDLRRRIAPTDVGAPTDEIFRMDKDVRYVKAILRGRTAVRRVVAILAKKTQKRSKK